MFISLRTLRTGQKRRAKKGWGWCEESWEGGYGNGGDPSEDRSLHMKQKQDEGMNALWATHLTLPIGHLC